MRIFNYDERTGELLAEGLARENPLEKGDFLIPRNATSVEPPAVHEGQVALFDAETQTWSAVDDDRGLWFAEDGAPIEVLALGAKVPQAVTRIEPTDKYQKFDGTAWQTDQDRKAAAAIADASVQCEAQVAVLRDKYPLSEILTWPKQEAEARALVLDRHASAPLLSTIAAARGIDLQDLAQRVIVKADPYTQLVGQAVGARQKAEDDIERATTAEVAEVKTK